MEAKDFVPQYDDSVFEYLLEDSRPPQHINKTYCLMPASAALLATLLQKHFPKLVIIYQEPVSQALGSPFHFNHFVPWFSIELPDGSTAERNAGQLAIYWGMPGVSDPVAECVIDINTLVEG